MAPTVKVFLVAPEPTESESTSLAASARRRALPNDHHISCARDAIIDSDGERNFTSIQHEQHQPTRQASKQYLAASPTSRTAYNAVAPHQARKTTESQNLSGPAVQDDGGRARNGP